MNQKGFTLIEIIVVVSVFTLLFTVSTIILTGLIPKASFVSSHQSLLSDIKGQQVKAMTGNTGGGGDGSPYGIYLESDRYTLFTGPAYSPSADDNFVVLLTNDLQITAITFPSDSIIFLQGSGEISGYSEGFSSFNLENINTGEQEVFELNKLGVVLPQ